MTGIIRSFYENLGNLETIKTLVHPDAAFIGVREKSYPELPLYGTFVGHEGMEQLFARLQKAFEPQMFTIDFEIEDNDVGFASGRFEHRLRESGNILRSRWAVLCRFADGKIIHYRFFEDTAALEEAFAVRTESRETVKDRTLNR